MPEYFWLISTFIFISFVQATERDKQVAIRGISIGGWLVTEPYITPSIYEKANSLLNGDNDKFTIIDEYTLCEKLSYNESYRLLKTHWDTWITEDDFQQISADGFNLVRLPIGYWGWKDNVNKTKNNYFNKYTFEDPYIGNGIQLQYLDQAIQWSKKYGLNVWIDLHGVPGSQNGFDNSGQRNLYGPLNWLKNHTSSEDITIAIWEDLMDKYLGMDHIVGIELVNEPLNGRINIDDIERVYKKGYKMYNQKRKNNNSTKLILHDAFEGVGYWNDKYNDSNIVIDHHHYEVFSDWQLNNTQWNRLFDISDYSKSIFENENFNGSNSIIGEWSAAITDCCHWLNGVNIGARYDRTYYNETANGRCDNFDLQLSKQEYRDKVREYIEMQLMTYETYTMGWIFWNWKTETDVSMEWDYKRLKDQGLFPSPLDNYTYFVKNNQANNIVESDGRGDNVTDQYAIVSDLYASISSEQFPSTTMKKSNMTRTSMGETNTHDDKNNAATTGGESSSHRSNTSKNDSIVNQHRSVLSMIAMALFSLLGG
ncbi:hypothetical protein TBLA_0J00800 [Henningerozyma blattae CBS 6284]|uniref:Uncharacterized protein n=1 Tax=Henningerozyma blattae (strain ATCC 34711 / CBS 6284 / DSM 70876 / NBRC 10599 / NRRL Y-10934 / UCD 77-7) TaxID=1071380 RepID=I2H9M6_HENB6|nr:hypothetical protein TBLA_0J00800 [Tetrapisispora blattae CBS 6284]CCH63078.1 hypothetical protein TBLA_0J00800 [Tetrapisispora blattae CBS 6284]